MRAGPLGDDARLAVELVLLEPGFDVGPDRLALLGAAAVLDDRAELPGDAVAEQVVVGAPVGGARGGGVVGRGRGPRLEVLVAGERLGDQPRADRLAVRVVRSGCPRPCRGNTVWPIPSRTSG